MFRVGQHLLKYGVIYIYIQQVFPIIKSIYSLTALRQELLKMETDDLPASGILAHNLCATNFQTCKTKQVRSVIEGCILETSIPNPATTAIGVVPYLPGASYTNRTTSKSRMDSP